MTYSTVVLEAVAEVEAQVGKSIPEKVKRIIELAYQASLLLREEGAIHKSKSEKPLTEQEIINQVRLRDPELKAAIADWWYIAYMSGYNT